VTRAQRAGAGRRDRRGRGVRGPLVPPSVPAALPRSERFDDLVLDAVERLERHLPELARVEVVVEDVPPAAVLRDGEPVPLGRAEPAAPGRPARLVVHRRTVELRARDRGAVDDLVTDVVAEQVAALFGLTPEQVDPDYDPDD
jgi:predicted Zn-dependent protease with MMP-like domain